MWTRLGKATLTALVVILAAEFAARATVSRIDLPNSYDVPRNPNFRRAWPAYTEPRERGPNDKLVILISNSQGYAPELEDGDLCYAHLIQTQLNEHDPGHHYKVANWSIGGASGPEMLLLAARAIDHNPDLLMIVTHSNPFSSSRANMQLPFLISDANQLICIRSIRNRLPGWFRRRQGAVTPDIFFQYHCGLVQLRDNYIEQREERWVPRQLRTDRSGPESRRLPRAPRVRRQGEVLFDAMVRVFHDERPDTPVLAISMPLCQSKWHHDTWPNLYGFGSRMQELVAEGFPGDTTITAIDAVDAVDETMFLTQAHMKPAGHAAFARHLLPYLMDRLGLSSEQTRTDRQHTLSQ